MLVVDSMKRITIAEIRQHAWFQAHLPRYLAVPPPATTQQAKKVGHISACLAYHLRYLEPGSVWIFWTMWCIWLQVYNNSNNSQCESHVR